MKITQLSLTIDNVIPVDVSPHYSLNTKKGVIRCQDIRDCADDEILDGLKDEDVVKVERIMVFRDGQRKPTGTFILTFQTQVLPKYIKVGYYRVSVSQFIPNPIRCFKCQRYGHTKFHCRKNEVCNKCGQEDHTDHVECKNEAKCVNCQGNHASNDRSCPRWKEEKEIQRIKAERGISYTEAKKQIEIFNSVKTTYAQAAAPTKPTIKTVSVETQTDVTWPNNVTKPQKCPVDKQTINKTTKTTTSSQTSQKDQPKLTVNQSRFILNRQPKGTNDPVKQFNKFGVLTEDDGTMEVDNPPILNTQGRKDNIGTKNGTK